MDKKKILWVSILVLFLSASGVAIGQPRGREGILAEGEVRQLGRNYEVNLVMEPTVDKEGFTVVTATDHFLVETEIESGNRRVELAFEGRISLKESQMQIGAKRVASSKPILVSYRIKMQGGNTEKEGGFGFGLQGSALLEENKQVVIAKSKNMILKLKISSLQGE